MSRTQVRLGVLLALVVGCGLPLTGSVLARGYRQWVNGPVHSVVEALGMFAGLTLAALLLLLRRYKGGYTHHVWTACGLVGMGVVDGFHAACSPGNTFVWLRSTATLVGGIFFALIWLPERASHWRAIAWLPMLVLIGACVLGVGSAFWPEVVPVMLVDGQFSTIARQINTLGGIAFLLASFLFLIRHHQMRTVDDFLFACFSLLFGMAGVLFWTSKLWDADWWWWHFLRLAAYLLVLGQTFLIYLRDQEELKMLNESLERKVAERTARTRAILNAAADGIITIDECGVIESVNPAAERLFGYQADELIGQKVNRLMPSPYSGEHDSYLTRYLTTGQRKVIGVLLEVVGQRKDGTTFPIELTVSEVHLADLRLFTGITRDISERRAAEKALREAVVAAERANRAKSEFLANMSHEIRTPMNGILGMTELTLGTTLTADQREYLTMAKASGIALLTLLNDILDFSKIEAGKLDLDPIPFRLRDTVEDAVRSLAHRAYEKGLELTCHVANDVPDALVGDAGRLRQIVINLVGNAVKFTNRGDVVVYVRVERTDEAGEVELHFAVTDTGIGIPPDKLSRLFEPFSQVDGSMTRKYGGTGLGLAIVRQLAGLMKGRTWGESQLGQGSTFHFTACFAPQPHPPSPVAPSLHGIAVLIVDDNAVNRTLFLEVLTGWGMRPMAADRGTAALAEMETALKARTPFQLVLVDCMMPEMDGFEVALAIKRHPELSRCPVIMLSSAAASNDRERCRQLGLTAYLTKPIRQSELREVLLLAVGVETAPVAPVETMADPVSSLSARRPLCILLAEDNRVNQKLVVCLLENEGHTVVVANNGHEAVTAFFRQAFDLVLMDMQMPEMDGFEATAVLRASQPPGTARVPIVALTAHALKGDRERCIEAGMDDYLAKPIHPAQLREMIERLVPAR